MGFFGSLEAIRVKIAEILQIVIINNSFIYINLWSVVHLTSGFLVAWILYHFFKKKDKITILNTLGILVIYEAFELLAFVYLSRFLSFVREFLTTYPSTIENILWYLRDFSLYFSCDIRYGKGIYI